MTHLCAAGPLNRRFVGVDNSCRAGSPGGTPRSPDLLRVTAGTLHTGCCLHTHAHTHRVKKHRQTLNILSVFLCSKSFFHFPPKMLVTPRLSANKWSVRRLPRLHASCRAEGKCVCAVCACAPFCRSSSRQPELPEAQQLYRGVTPSMVAAFTWTHRR